VGGGAEEEEKKRETVPLTLEYPPAPAHQQSPRTCSSTRTATCASPILASARRLAKTKQRYHQPSLLNSSLPTLHDTHTHHRTRTTAHAPPHMHTHAKTGVCGPHLGSLSCVCRRCAGRRRTWRPRFCAGRPTASPWTGGVWACSSMRWSPDETPSAPRYLNAAPPPIPSTFCGTCGMSGR
jgi:hypothetical protein